MIRSRKHRKNSIRTAALRSCSGQGLSESAAALVVLALLTVGSVIFVVDLSTLLSLQMKLCAIADACAQSAADDTIWLGAPRPAPFFAPAAIETRTQALAQSLVQQYGIDASSVTATVDQSSNQTCVVTLTMTAPPLISSAIFPQQFVIKEVGSQPYPNDPPIAVLTLGFANSGVIQNLSVPAYGAADSSTPGPTSYPGGNFPFWQGTPDQAALVGPFQNTVGAASFSSY